MRERARLESIREVLEIFLSTFYPLDHILKKYLSTRRYIGSKDRQFIQNHLFDLFRHWEIVKWKTDLSARSLVISYLNRILKWQKKDFDIEEADTSEYDFVSLTSVEAEDLSDDHKNLEKYPAYVQFNIPSFLWLEFEKTYGADLEYHAQALQQKGTLDLRVNTLKTERSRVLQAFGRSGIEAHLTPHSPWGIRLVKRIHLENLDLFRSGHIEVQDEGSQLLTLFCQPKPHDTILDLCAGAGGKTLALAAMMNNGGKIVATDIDQKRLQKIYPRLTRAGIGNVEVQEKISEKFDRILIDAPCSGTGTWRRTPDLRVRLTPKSYTENLKAQTYLLEKACHFIKEEGTLIYATCSVLKSENEEQVTSFLNNHPEFHLTRELRLSPLSHQTDGFYGAALKRNF